MKTFDYAAAWREVARPAYDTLPQNVRDLLTQVATEAGNLHQLPDTSMPWPDDPQLGDKQNEGSDLRARFDTVPAEWLAYGARVIHACGHWFPSGGDLNLPGRSVGAHWKFAHYADQSLRARLMAATSPDKMRANGPYQVHEGAIRICYSSPNAWQWHEVAPATAAGLARAEALYTELARAIGKAAAEADAPTDRRYKRTANEARDSGAHTFFESLDTRDLEWPTEGWARIMGTAQYMREEQEIKAREMAARPPVDRDKLKAKIIAAAATQVAKVTRKVNTERDAHVWLIDHGLDLDNVIYYDHEGVFCFGWRDKVPAETVARILAVISEFPYPYRIKCADGRTLEGGIG